MVQFHSPGDDPYRTNAQIAEEIPQMPEEKKPFPQSCITQLRTVM